MISLFCINQVFFVRKWNIQRVLIISSTEQKRLTLTKDILKCIFFNETLRILIKISLTYVLWDPIDNKSVWQLFGDKPLTEPTLTRLFDVICSH